MVGLMTNLNESLPMLLIDRQLNCIILVDRWFTGFYGASARGLYNWTKQTLDINCYKIIFPNNSGSVQHRRKSRQSQSFNIIIS